MASHKSSNRPGKHRTTVEVVCFGMITPAMVLAIDKFPEQNTGTLIKQYSDFISDDAAIIACLLRKWKLRTGLIGTTLGDDRWGRWVAKQLKSLGVRGKVRLDPEIITPLEVNISDRTGERTYFWQRNPEVLETLDTADIRLIKGTRLLYVDWYDGDCILRAIEKANKSSIPVFLNLEHAHQDTEIVNNYARKVTICQAVTDVAQRGSESPIVVAQKLLQAGVKIAIVTLAGEGCLVANKDKIIRVWAPSIEPVDGCGAGATFSAGFIYGYLQGWSLKKIARFATAAASLKCLKVGLKLPKISKCLKLAESLQTECLNTKSQKIEHLTLRNELL